MPVVDQQAQETLDSFPAFADRVDAENRVTEEQLEVMQVNITRRCNLACKHCHVDAGPHRADDMPKEVMEQCLQVFAARGFTTLDITGGAPEMHPDFEWFLHQAAACNAQIMVRSNLVVLQQEAYAHLPQLYADLGVNVIASLPHYTQKKVDKQRGDGSFDGVIAMLQLLNSLGYGKGAEGTNASGKLLQLDLVFNPSGALLPPDQQAMEAEYKVKLKDDYGIVFNNLFTITNNPLGRFGAFLERSGNLKRYMTKLIDAFNPETLPGMMCRHQASIGLDGTVYDCDFNQAAELPSHPVRKVGELADASMPLRRAIAFGNHCYACTAGAGSS